MIDLFLIVSKINSGDDRPSVRAVVKSEYEAKSTVDAYRMAYQRAWWLSSIKVYKVQAEEIICD